MENMGNSSPQPPYMIRCVMGLEKCTKKFFLLKAIKSFVKYYTTKEYFLGKSEGI